MTLAEICAVGIGSAAGGMCRYLLSGTIKISTGTAFPLGTLTVNLLGCLIIGCFSGWFSCHGSQPVWIKLLLTTGFCGGFTTFSTFSDETLHLLQSGQMLWAVLYIAISIAGGLLCVAAGYMLAR